MHSIFKRSIIDAFKALTVDMWCRQKIKTLDLNIGLVVRSKPQFLN